MLICLLDIPEKSPEDQKIGDVSSVRSGLLRRPLGGFRRCPLAMGGSCRKPDAQPSAQKPAQPDPPAEEETKSADPPSQREELRLRAKEWASMHFAPGGYLDPHPPPEPDPPPAVSVIPRDALCGGDVEAEAPPDESSPCVVSRRVSRSRAIRSESSV